MDETEGRTARTESKDSSCSWPGLLLHAVLPLGHSLGRGRGLLLTVNWDHDQMWTDCQRACEGGMYFHSSQGGALGPNLQPCLTLLDSESELDRLCHAVMHNKKSILGLQSGSWHRAPKTLGIF